VRNLLVSILVLFAVPVFAVPVEAGTVAGLWLTGPDQKGQVGHILLAPCGANLCGTVVTAIDKAGRSVKTPNVGKQVIWDVKEVGADRFAGQMHVSHFNATVKGQFLVSGHKMTVRGCLGPVCQSQVWTRLK